MGLSKAEISRWNEESGPVIERLKKAGCRFVQMELPDINGALRGKLVTIANGFSAAGTATGTLILSFKGGGKICFTTPFSGGGETGFPKIVAVPDLSTAVALPWKCDVAAVLCDYYLEAGSPCALSPRHILRSAEAALAKLNYFVRIALECEFYIVEENDALMREGRYSELQSFQRGLDVWSLQRAPSFEDLAKEFMNRCDAVGIPIETFHTDCGHGMFEYSLAPQSALKAADDSVRAKLLMRQLCSERGLAACYMAAKFFETEAAFAGDTFSGCHHNFSLVRGTENVFWDASAERLSQVAHHAAAGILETTSDFSVIYHPWVNSYRRMNYHFGAPENASWGPEHHFAAIRVVHGALPEKQTRFEHRVSGADINPYLTIASLVHGALIGIRENLVPPPYASGEVTLEKNGRPLPRTLPAAIELFRNSKVAAAAFGTEFVEHLAIVKKEEWDDFAKAVASPETALTKGPVTNWEFERYFNDA
jgi:glutamine synthetase